MTQPIFILAGEPSGDQIAAKIMSAINSAYGQQDWFGMGGQKMKDLGLRNEADMDQLSIIGFGAAVKAYPNLSRLADRLVDMVIQRKPRAVMTVDAKGFSLRFARRLKRRMAEVGWTAPIIHTVAPTVWAWGAWRARSMADVVDGLLCLFPFEPEYFTSHGIDARFIGHPEAFNPALTKINDSRKPGTGRKNLLLLPGSRTSEITRILPLFRDASALLKEQREIEISLVTMPYLAELVKDCLGDKNDISVFVHEGALYEQLADADAVMAASGTVTLQTALAGVPGVTAYRTSNLSAFIGRRLVNMDKVILPNALLGKTCYPFLFQEEASANALADHASNALDTGYSAAKANAASLRNLLCGGAADFDSLVGEAVEPWFAKN